MTEYTGVLLTPKLCRDDSVLSLNHVKVRIVFGVAL